MVIHINKMITTEDKTVIQSCWHNYATSGSQTLLLQNVYVAPLNSSNVLYHHETKIELSHLLTRSVLTHLEVS